MCKYLTIFILLFLPSALLFSSSLEFPLFDYVAKCDLIIQGEITHIDHYSGYVTDKNIRTFQDTAYIKVNKIYKTNSNNIYQNQDVIKLLMPAKIKTTKDGMAITISTDIFYKVGQNGIWLLKEKNGAYHAQHYQAFQLNSKESLIQELCKINPSILKLLNGIFWSRYSEVKQCLKLAEIDPNDSIFHLNEINPLLLAVRYRKIDLIQDIIDYGFNLNFKNANDENALFIAVKRSTGDLRIIETLLLNGIETEIINKQGVSINDLVNKSKNKEDILELFQKYKE